MANMIKLGNGLNVIKTYVALPGVSEQTLLSFCDTTVRQWLDDAGVQRAEFWTVTNDDGLLQLVVAMDREDTEWGTMNGISTVMATYGPNRLTINEQPTLSVAPPNPPQQT